MSSSPGCDRAFCYSQLANLVASQYQVAGHHKVASQERSFLIAYIVSGYAALPLVADSVPSALAFNK